MSEVEFKVGDKVYCPHLTTRILKVVASENSPNLVAIESNNKLIDITTDGKVWNKQGLVSDVFPATQENYELLSKLYPNVTFEPPPKRKEPKEIIKAMLDSGAIFIPCLVADYDDNRILDYKKATRHNSSVLIYGISENGRFLSTNPHCSSYKYAVPFDIETGKVIIDFVDGEVVLESENVN